MTWLEEIINTFKSLGGTASLNEVYDFIAQTTARTLSQSWKSIVRGIIEDHSSDAAFRSGKDIFYSVGGKGSGRWALRNWPTEGVNYLSVFSIALPEEISDFQVFQEGAKKQITVNIYERNLVARQECIKYYGLNCLVCGFNFHQKYGDVGAGIIHVHHLRPLSEIGKSYRLDPIKDLRPVCPNCHAIIHCKNPPYSMEEMQTILRTKTWLE